MMSNQQGSLVPISPSVPYHLEHRLLWLPDRARNMGIHIVAGRGSGKSRMMGRLIEWLDFVRGIPSVVIDPNGGTIDNFLDKIIRLPREYQERLWKRVIYIDMNGSAGYVTPFPLYYRLADESLYTISQRLPDVIRKVDPTLQSASIEGFNALWRIATYSGMLLAASGVQITEVEALLHNPETWISRLSPVLTPNPQTAPAIAFFQNDYASWNDAKRASRTDAFLTKVSPFSLDPTMRAIIGAGSPGINWQQVVDKNLTVLIDFRHIHDAERLRFLMLWVVTSFIDFIKFRGVGRHKPISLIIDEFAYLVSLETSGADLLAADFDELINRLARAYMVWVTIAHQEQYQLSERMQKTLMTMGTQILGVTTDSVAALNFARRFHKYDPYRVKKQEPIYASFQGVSQIIDYRDVEYSIEEQRVLASYHFMDLEGYHFLVAPAPAEGTVSSVLRPISIGRFDQGKFVNEELVARARRLLVEKRGRKVSEVLAEIEARSRVPRLPGPPSLTAQVMPTNNSQSHPTLWDDDLGYEER